MFPGTPLAGQHQHQRLPVNVDTEGSEILRLYAYVRPASGTIPEMRLDSFGLRLHRCNQLEIVKSGSRFRTPEPRKSTSD